MNRILEKIWDLREEISILLGIFLGFSTLVYYFYKKIKFIYLYLLFKKNKLQESNIAKKCFHYYENKQPELIKSNELALYLAERYYKFNKNFFNCQPFEILGKKFPAYIIWQNDKLLNPNKILLDKYYSKYPKKLTKSLYLNKNEYKNAREYIAKIYEKDKIKTEFINYRMTKIDLNNGENPIIHGELGWYYDNKLTQYAIEWELNKALSKLTTSNLKKELSKKGILPLRELVELKDINPILNGNNRCASITLSALIVFKNRNGEYHFILNKRSEAVKTSSNLMHVVPSGMAEPFDANFTWDFEYNFWREFLEEIYNLHEYHFQDNKFDPHSIFNETPIKYLKYLLDNNKAQFSITGICCDLLNLRPEICMILVIDDAKFLDIKKMFF